MRVYLHIPAYREHGKREVPIDLPIAPFIGMTIGVTIGDGTPSNPSRASKVQVTGVEINHTWKTFPEPTPVEDSGVIEVFTEWVRVPGRRTRG